MPLSEFYRMAGGSLESSRQRTATCSTDLSHVPDNEFVELVWENGQIMWQGQSSKSRRTNFESQCPKLRDKYAGNATNSKMGKFGAMDSVLNAAAAPVPSVDISLDQDDDAAPWFDYPFGSLQQDYCSELLTELSGVTANELSAQNSFPPIDKGNRCNQTIRGSHSVSVHNGSSLEQPGAPKISSPQIGESFRSKGSQFYPGSFQGGQTSVPSLKSGVSNVNNINNTSNIKQAVCIDSIQAQTSAGASPSTKIQKQHASITNFSYFSRPAALVRANLHDVASKSSIEVMGDKTKGMDPSINDLTKSTRIDLSSGSRKDMGGHSQPNLVASKVDSEPVEAKPVDESRILQRSEAVCQEDVVEDDKSPINDASTFKAIPDVEKNGEAMVASSSVCSANGAERASDGPTRQLKRKWHDTDESEEQSEDVDDESVRIRKAAPARGGTGSKRSRAAEVHNLSERRRRDRINEKMRALQELIPNCNKADKASMLDEAIEYLKTLQLQVQIMSMGAGFYMPPMMVPPIHAPHMAHFSPLRVGMGMGMGFGMGMLDINTGSSACPMIQLPPMQGAYFPALHPTPVSGAAGFQGVAGPNSQVFGHPGQGIPMSATRAPLLQMPGGPPLNSAMGQDAAWRAALAEVPNLVPTSNPTDSMQNANSQMVHNADACGSLNQTSNQCRARNDGLQESTLVPNTDQAPDVRSSEKASLNKENDIKSSRPGCE